MLSTASRWLDETLQASDSETFRYWRGSAYVDVSAVFSSTAIGTVLSDGVTQSWQTTDIIVPVEDLILGGHQVTPQLGDRVEKSINGQSVSFKVAEADDSRTHRFADAVTREQFRIHLREAP